MGDVKWRRYWVNLLLITGNILLAGVLAWTSKWYWLSQVPCLLLNVYSLAGRVWLQGWMDATEEQQKYSIQVTGTWTYPTLSHFPGDVP